MALLPFDDWIYKLPYKRDEVNQLYKDCVAKQTTIQEKILSFNTQVEQYQQLLTNNAALLLFSAVSTMNELELKNFQADISKTPPPDNWKGYPALRAVGIIVEVAVVGVAFVKILLNMKTIAYAFKYQRVTILEEDALEMTTRDIGSVADVTGLEYDQLEALYKKTDEPITEETVGELASASSRRLLATGVIGIFVALGIDVIFGAINGKKTEDELNKVLKELKAKMKKLDQFIDRINNNKKELQDAAVKQMDVFKNVCDELQKVYPSSHKAQFSWDIPSTLDKLPQFLEAQSSAIKYFALLPQLRSTYTIARERNPGVQRDAIVNAVLLTAPEWVTQSLMDEIWDIMIKYSLATTKWDTIVDNPTHWKVTANGVEIKEKQVVIPYSASGVEILVNGKGKIFLTDDEHAESTSGVPVYGVHVVSGSFDGTYFPDVVNNAMFVSIRPDGTFQVRPGVGGIPIENDVEDHAAVVNSGSHITIPPNATYNFGVNSFSISANFLTDRPGVLLSKEKGFALAIEEGGKIKFAAYEGTSKNEVNTESTKIFNGEWHHIAAVRNGTNLSVYLDGKHIPTTDSSDLTRPANVNSSEGLILGAITGSIRNVSLWNNEIPSNSITKIMFNGCVGSENGLVGYWPMNSSLVDLTANHNNGSGPGITFFPVIHCTYRSSGTNHFTYCSMDAIHTNVPENSAGNVTRKQTVVVDAGAPFLYANLSKTGNLPQFPEGVMVTVTDPTGNTFASTTDTEDLFVLTNNHSLWTLVVKNPNPGEWTINTTAPTGVSFKFELQTTPSADISETIFKEMAIIYGISTEPQEPLRRTVRALNATRSLTSRSITGIFQFIDTALAVASYQLWAAVILVSVNILRQGKGGAIKALTAYLGTVTLAYASTFIGTMFELGILEATKKLLGFSDAIPASAGTSIVYVWTFRGSNEAWGHASIGLSDGTHISWWPSSPRDPLVPYPFSEIPMIENIYEAPAYPYQTYDQDCTDEEQDPDYKIPIKVLDEGAIKSWWNDFRLMEKWRTLDNNCSTVVMKAIVEGGVSKVLSVRENIWRKSVVIWTPSDVVELANIVSAYNP